MNRYLKADFYRIFGRVSRYITLLILFIAFGAILFAISDGATPYGMVETVTQIVNTVVVPVFGLVEYGVVYSDDLKAKTMQIAIGTGVSRKKVIFTKWLEIVLLTALDLAVFLLIAFVVSRVRGVVFSGEPLRDVLILSGFSLVKLAGAAAITSILLFGTMNATLGMILFIAAAFGILYFLVSAIITIGPLESLHLDQYLFSSLLEAAKSRAVIGTISVPHIVGIIVYLVVFYLIACRAFRKVELEF